MPGNQPIPNRNQKDFKIANAPTPHNTPSNVSSSYLKQNTSPKVDVEKYAAGKNTIKEEEPVGSASENSQDDNDEEDDDDEEEESGAAATAAAVGLLKNEALLQNIQAKLGDLVGQDSGYVNSLTPAIKNRIYALKALQHELMEEEKKFQIEMYKLEARFAEQNYKPILERRANIIAGLLEPTKEEIAEGKAIEQSLAGEDEDDDEDDEEEHGEEEEDEEDDDDEEAGVPAFWLTAFDNLPTVSQTITDRDAVVLEYLQDIELKYLAAKDDTEKETPLGFELVFKFESDINPYFTNDTLTKKYYYQVDLGYSGDFVYDHAEGCEIDWVSNDVNVTVEVETKKQRNKNTKKIREVKKITPVESFFNFFDPPKIPQFNEDNEDNEEDDDDFEEQDEELEGRLALDYALGEEFKDKLIPRAIDWFTGVALDFEMDGMDGHEEGDEFDDEEEYFDDEEGDDDEEEEEDEEDEFANVKKEQPPECKQS